VNLMAVHEHVLAAHERSVDVVARGGEVQAQHCERAVVYVDAVEYEAVCVPRHLEHLYDVSDVVCMQDLRLEDGGQRSEIERLWGLGVWQLCFR
jgi:hypothetical protein